MTETAESNEQVTADATTDSSSVTDVTQPVANEGDVSQDTQSGESGQENQGSSLLGEAESGQPAFNIEDMKIADGSLINEQDKTKFAEFAQQNELSADKAQATLDLIAETKASTAQELQATQQEAYQKEVDAWKQELAQDKELGGENLAQTDKNATQVLLKYWGSDFLKTMQDNGLGAFPGFIRGLVAVHNALSPQGLAEGSSVNAGRDDSPQAAAERMFPSSMLNKG